MVWPTSTTRARDHVRRTRSGRPRNSYVALTRMRCGVSRPSVVFRSARQRSGRPWTEVRDPDGGTGARDEPSPARKAIEVPGTASQVALNDRHRRKSSNGVKVSERIVPEG